jgi:hypothetical protein
MGDANVPSSWCPNNQVFSWRRQNLKRVRPPGSVPNTAVAERGSMRNTNHGGGPCDGALKGAVMPEPPASRSAGQPSAAHVAARRSRVSGSVTFVAMPSMTTSAPRIEMATEQRGSSARLWNFLVPACLEPERAVQPDRTDGGHVRAAVLVDRDEPLGASVVRLWGRRRSRVEVLDDGRPVDRWQAVCCAQVDDLHGEVLPPSLRPEHRLRTLPARRRTSRGVSLWSPPGVPGAPRPRPELRTLRFGGQPRTHASSGAVPPRRSLASRCCDSQVQAQSLGLRPRRRRTEHLDAKRRGVL